MCDVPATRGLPIHRRQLALTGKPGCWLPRLIRASGVLPVGWLDLRAAQAHCAGSMSSASLSWQQVSALGLFVLVVGAGGASAASCGGKASSTTAKDGGPSGTGGDAAGDEASVADGSMGGDAGAPGVDSSAMGETSTSADSG